MSDNNHEFWDNHQTSDPKYVKSSEYGAGLSSIDGYHMFRKATEAFGMCGIGWGYEIANEELRNGAPCYDKKTKEIIGHEIDHTILLKLWYKIDGERGEVSHFGITRFVYSTKYGMATDEEAPKKSLTDAIKKCLSMLGICADVFLGKFDDEEYVKQAARVAEMIENETIDEATQKEVERIEEWLSKQIESVKPLTDSEQIKKVLRNVYPKVTDKCKLFHISPTPYHDQIMEIINSLDSEKEAA